MKMNRSVSLFINLLFYLNFVNSEEHYDAYKNWLKLLQHRLKPAAKNVLKFYEQICDNISENKYRWASICKNVIHRMRNVNNGECDNVFVDYLAFEGNEKCSFIEVSIPGWNEKVLQPVLFCYVRQAIIPLDGSIEPPPYKKVAVYPKNTQSIFVFKYHPVTEVYNLAYVFDNFQWNKRLLISHRVFDIPVPNSYSKVNEIYNKLYKSVQNLEENSKNNGSIFTDLDPVSFKPLCEVTYRSGKYRNLIIGRISKIPKTKLTNVTLLSAIEGKPEIHFDVSLYMCLMKDKTSPRRENIRDYYLAAGPDKNSVILVQRMGKEQYVVIEYIENLHHEYIKYFRNY